MIRVALIMLALLIVPTSAGAQTNVDAEMQANLDRAAAYWGASPDCPNGVSVTYDQTRVGEANFAVGGACGIWVGDGFAAETPGAKCQTITHEWGHLLGYGHTAGLPNDPVGVMVSFDMPGSCAALEPQTALDPQPVAPGAARAAWAAYDAAYVKWATQRGARSDCTVGANMLRHRSARVAARSRCVKRYGTIRRGPAEPAVPRPG